MALKDLLVHVDAGAFGMARLRLAADLAIRHHARLTVLHVREPSLLQAHRLKSAELGLLSGEQMQALERSIEQELDQNVASLRALLDELRREHGLDAEWRSVAGHAADLVTQWSRIVDLSIVGHDLSAPSDLPDEYSFAETMLFMSGRPLIIVPALPCPPTLGRRIAVAWNASRPAAHALADAIPLIERAEDTIVLTAVPRRPRRPAAQPPDAVLVHLGRHTDHVQACTVQAQDRSTADALQTEALARGADLLVAGAYGHPKLWEKMLGGTTRDLLACMRLPLLMSH